MRALVTAALVALLAPLLLHLAATRLRAVTAPAAIAYVDGRVMVKRAGEEKPVPAELGMSLFYGDQVRTLQGKAQVNMTASGILRLSPNTTVLFPAEENPGEKISVVRMLEGKTWTNIKQLSKDEVFEVRSPSLVAAVQGTKLIVEYNPRTRVATLIVEEGRVRGVMTAAGREIERLVETAKQVSVNSQTGVVTAVVDADLSKIRNEFGDQIFKGAENVIEEIFLTLTSPMDNAEVAERAVPVSGSVSDPTVREVVVTVGAAGQEDQARRVRIPVKNGKFEGQLEIGEGETQIEIEVRNPAGKKTTRKLKVRRVARGEALQVFLDAPASGATLAATPVAVEGRVTGGATDVRITRGGTDIGVVRVVDGKFRVNVELTEGKNVIEAAAALRDRTARAAVEVTFRRPATTGTTPTGTAVIEQPPSAPVLIFQEAGTRGAFHLVGNVTAMPAVTEVAVYIDGRLYKRERVENNGFKAFIQLADAVTRITVVPIWKGTERTAATATYRDIKAPDINIALPVANTTFTEANVTTKPDTIALQAVVTDELLRSIEYKINLDTPKFGTYTGVNQVSYQQPLRLYEGQNTIYIIAKDYFGNSKQASVVVYYERPKVAQQVLGGVTDQVTKQPIRGAVVQLVPISGQSVSGVNLKAVTDAQGRYTFTNIPAGRYVLIIAHDNYLPGQKEISVTGGTVTNVPTTSPTRSPAMR